MHARAHLRVARPADDPQAMARLYCEGLGFEILGSFEDHDGFDGVMLGHAGSGYHLELTRQHGVAAGRAPSPEHLLVFYLPDRSEWREACERMEHAGFRAVASHNPYWDKEGRTFEDPDGWRVVLQRAAWPAPTDAAPVSAASTVTLQPVTPESVRAVCRLTVRPDQERFVAPNAVSIAQAHFADHAWFRAVHAADTPVGFVMLAEEPERPRYYLWRFMIDHRYQRLGFGARAMALVIEHVRGLPGATELLLSVVQEPGGPQPFYEGLGFRATGAYEGTEAVLRLDLRA
jgi:GNAT superfamily N-acetyltransferase